MDRSNGYEAVAGEFLALRGSLRSTGVGVSAVRKWAQALPRGAAVIDLGCGPGLPLTEVLVAEGLDVFGIDAAPSFVQAFRRNFPDASVACEAVQDSKFFDRAFEGALAWGLIFLLSPRDQERLIQRIADVLMPGGRLLFTSPAEPVVWTDVLTGLESRSLGAKAYRAQLSNAGLSVASEYEDEGQNHYYDAVKDGQEAGRPTTAGTPPGTKHSPPSEARQPPTLRSTAESGSRYESTHLFTRLSCGRSLASPSP